MPTGRMEAFSDGVLAIAITIMVLELHDPKASGWHDLQQALPTLLVYLLSFVYVGIYWNNHHHLVAATGGVDGLVLWANLHPLFWLSLVPWRTSWVGSSDFASVAHRGLRHRPAWGRCGIPWPTGGHRALRG